MKPFRSTVILIFAATTALAASALAAPSTQPADILRTFTPGHARLLASDADIARVKQLISSDPAARRLFDAEKAYAAELMAGPDPTTRKDVTDRLLKPVLQAGAMYRLTGQPKYADYVRHLLLLACGPTHAVWGPGPDRYDLLSSDYVTAVAVGYDWIYDRLSDQDRQTISTALVDRGLKAGLNVYQHGTPEGWWRNIHNNWNNVCNGGLMIGALAVADQEPKLAAEILACARQYNVNGLLPFDPDGGCEEGPMYWNYGTMFQIMAMASLRNVLGNDLGLSDFRGLRLTGWYYLQNRGPLGLTFSYADSGAGASPMPQMFWMARAFHQPLYAACEKNAVDSFGPGRDRTAALNLLWYPSPAEIDESRGQILPTTAFFRRIGIVDMRSGFNDPRAFFIGFKGGSNTASHGHLDLGTFVLDALGQRFALDLGRDDYSIPGYFDKVKRWDVFRLSTPAHNTLTFDSRNQEPDGNAPILALSDDPADQYAVADLTDAYRTNAARVLRGIALRDRRHVLVQDEFQLRIPAAVAWSMLTQADVKISPDGRTATLSRNGASLVFHVASAPSEDGAATFSLDNSQPPPPNSPNPGVHTLHLRPATPIAHGRLAVWVTPAGDSTPPPPLEDLSRWISRHPISAPAGEK